MKAKQTVAFLALAVLITLFFVFDLQRFLTFEYIASQRDAISAFQQQRPLTTRGGVLCPCTWR